MLNIGSDTANEKISSIRNTDKLALAIDPGMATPLTHASDINFSGFLSVGGGMIDDENSLAYGGYDEEDFTLDDNLLGALNLWQYFVKINGNGAVNGAR